MISANQISSLCSTLYRTGVDPIIFGGKSRHMNVNSLDAFKSAIFPLVNIQYKNLTKEDFELIIKSYIEADKNIEDILEEIGPKIRAFYKKGKGTAERATFYYVLQKAKELDPNLAEVLEKTEHKRRAKNGINNFEALRDWWNNLTPKEQSEVQRKRSASKSIKTRRNSTRIAREAQGIKEYDKEINGLTEREYILALANTPKYQHQEGNHRGRPDWKKITAQIDEVYGNNRSIKTLTERYYSHFRKNVEKGKEK